MTSDDSKRVGVSYTHPSPVGVMTFRCGKCSVPRSMLGRKLQRVKGIRQFVCKQCVEKQ